MAAGLTTYLLGPSKNPSRDEEGPVGNPEAAMLPPRRRKRRHRPAARKPSG
jgi:hypothetical protein